jgi:lipoic acid synthetase
MVQELRPKFHEWVNPHPKVRFREEIAKLPMNGLFTICEEAKCPNRGECLPKHRTLSIMVMGRICTRRCPFCSVSTGKPEPLDPWEPQKVSTLAQTLNLKYLVMTSPNRDELPDGGASQWVKIISTLRHQNPELKIEILVPDFQGRQEALEQLLQNPPDVLAHDLQTVPRLYPTIRPGAQYHRSLSIFQWFKPRLTGQRKNIFLKAGMMVGLGEKHEEVFQVLEDSKKAGVDFFTIGQYLKPPGSMLEVVEYLPQEDYERFKNFGQKLGLRVQASPLTRSSYLADQLTQQ